jgi:hypothetical protein
VRKGQQYRIAVSDLRKRRPIWFDGPDRSQASMEQFYQWLGPKGPLRNNIYKRIGISYTGLHDDGSTTRREVCITTLSLG